MSSTIRSIAPVELQSYVNDWHMSPALAANGSLFFTGFTGVRADGSIADDPAEQVQEVFAKIALVLREAGTDFGAVVEMTSYHVGLQDHLSVFRSIRDSFVVAPYPAWTAIEVSGFVTKGAVVEVRVIARAP